MKIAVFVKQVPDTETKLVIAPGGHGIQETGIKYIVNPYDEFAIEEAIKTKEKVAGSVVTVVSVGPERCVEAMRTALAMGCDQGLHIVSAGGEDSFVAASALAKVARDKSFDVIFCGKQGIDKDFVQVPQMVAELLAWPHVMVVNKFELAPDHTGAVVARSVGGGALEIYELAFPMVLGCDKALNKPRYASLPGIMKAKTKPVEKIPLQDLVGELSPLMHLDDYTLPPERGTCKMIGGEGAAKELVRLLREEAKVL